MEEQMEDTKSYGTRVLKGSTKGSVHENTVLKSSIPGSLGHKRPLQEYTGTYQHPGFGDFTVYINESSGGLRYEFGLLLKGALNPTGESEDFFMLIEFPLDYGMVWYPQYPDGFPAYFGRDGEGNVDTITVPYLEFSLPPTFSRVIMATQ